MKSLAYDIIEIGTMVLREYGNQIPAAGHFGHIKEKASIVLLARNLRQFQAIIALTESDFVSDGWILLRSLLERYLLFEHLCMTREFEFFDNWCFKEQYDHLNRIKSIRAFQHKPEMKGRSFSDEEKARYQRICADEQVKHWRRPDMESVARKLDMKFLYDAGYDWASAYVHPISTDGIKDYLHLMDRGKETDSEDVTAIAGNACLFMILHIQRFLNEPEFIWRAVLYDLLDAFAKKAGGEILGYVEMVRKVEYFHRAGGGLLARKNDTGED